MHICRCGCDNIKITGENVGVFSWVIELIQNIYHAWYDFWKEYIFFIQVTANNVLQLLFFIPIHGQ
jgi:hypothetical protein